MAEQGVGNAHPYHSTIQKVYVAYYGRPADPGGLAYWAERLEQASGNLNEIIEAFANSAESEALFAAATHAERVTAIYQQLFNRDPDPGGLNFYTLQLQSGQMSQASIMLDVLNGAQNQDLQIVDNKLAAAQAFTSCLEEEGASQRYAGETAAEQVRNWLSSVDHTEDSLTQTNAQLTEMVQVIGEVPTLTATSITVAEDAGSVNIEVTRSGFIYQESSLAFATTNGSAAASQDYVANNGTLTFAAGQNSATITLNVLDDALVEGNEHFDLLFSTPVNATLAQSQISITLTDDDQPQFDSDTLNPTVNEDTTLNDTVSISNLGAGIGATFSLTTPSSNGSVSLNADGSYQYIPNANFHGDDSFQASVTTDAGTNETVTVSISVAAINDAPAFSVESLLLETLRDTAVNGNVSASDIDEDTLSYSVANMPGNGTVSIDGMGNYSYTPDANFSGDDSFSLQVSDGHSGTDSVTVSVNVIDTASLFQIEDLTIDEDQSSATVNITRSGFLSQTASLDYATSNGSATGGADFLASNGSVNFAAQQTTASITIDLTNDNLLEGDESFNLLFNNPVNASLAKSQISITINDDDQPQFDSDSLNPTVNEDATLNGSILINNLGSGIGALFSLTSQASNGMVSLNGNGSYQYTPNANYHGSDSFQANVTTDAGTTDAITVNITVSPVNDAPVFSVESLSLQTLQDTTLDGNASAGDIDEDNLSYSVGTQPNNGSVSIDAMGNYSYTPDNNFSGDDSFSLQVSDGNSGTDSVTVSVNVVDTSSFFQIDDLVVNESESTATVNVSRSGFLSQLASLNYATSNDSATSGADFQASNGTVNFAEEQTTASITLDLTDDTLLEGEESFNLLFSNPINATLSQSQISITITDNDQPQFNSDSLNPQVNEDATLNDSILIDNLAPGIGAMFTLTTQAGNGSVSLNADGSYQYMPNANFNGSDSFQATATTDTGSQDDLTINITVNPVNDAPTFAEDSLAIETQENAAVMGAVTATDIDEDTLTYSLSQDASNGSTELNSNGHYTYTPNNGFSGNDTFTIRVDDGAQGHDEIIVTVTVLDSQAQAAAFNRIESGVDTSAMLMSGDTPIISLESDDYWSSNNLSYSFNQSIPADYHDVEDLSLTGWRPISDAAESAAMDIFAAIAAFADLTFTEDLSGNGEFRFNAISLSGTNNSGFAYYPSDHSPIGGDIFLDADDMVSDIYRPGTQTHHTLVHELGHALGLKHPFDTPNKLSTALDTYDYTQMSYTEARNLLVEITFDASRNAISADYEWEAVPGVYGILDIAALQAIYGSNLNSATEDNSYSLIHDDHAYLTIWDGGGEDTIDLAASTGTNNIDLRSGQHSSVDVKTIDDQIAETLDWLDQQNAPDFSAWVNTAFQNHADSLYTGENALSIAYGVWIENVITGSNNDIVRDNAVNNTIQTGAGDDLIRLFDGGFDNVNGGIGTDTVELNHNSADVEVTDLGNGAYLLLGNDFAAEVVGIERIAFSDSDLMLV